MCNEVWSLGAPFLRSKHLRGLFQVWILWCKTQADLILYLFPHSKHLGRFPVQITWCVTIYDLCVTIFQQLKQQLGNLTPVWILWCRTKVKSDSEMYPTVSALTGSLSSVDSLMLRRADLFLKLFPQPKHSESNSCVEWLIFHKMWARHETFPAVKAHMQFPLCMDCLMLMTASPPYETFLIAQSLTGCLSHVET